MRWAIVMIAVTTGALCFGATAQERSDQEALKLIDPSVYVPYTKAGFPQTFSKFGAVRVLGPIQKLREQGALLAARYPACDFVEYSELAPSRSTVERPVVFVDCRSGMRFYLASDGKVGWEKVPR